MTGKDVCVNLDSAENSARPAKRGFQLALYCGLMSFARRSSSVSSASGYCPLKIRPFDFSQYAPIAFRLSSQTGYLLKQGTVNKYSMKKRYFALCGNLYVILSS
jgi:hypothetical protein